MPFTRRVVTRMRPFKLLKDLAKSLMRLSKASTRTKMYPYRWVKIGSTSALAHTFPAVSLGVFKLTHIAGAYWRGDVERDQLQEIRTLGQAKNSLTNIYLCWKRRRKEIIELSARNLIFSFHEEAPLIFSTREGRYSITSSKTTCVSNSDAGFQRSVRPL